MTIGERMFKYRAEHNISQAKLALLLNEPFATIVRCEGGKHKPHKANALRLEIKMNGLEKSESDAKYDKT